MDSVSASVAARAKQLTEKQREFVRATASLAKSLGFSQMLRSQITMNAILLCQGAISRVLFLSFTGSRQEFQELLKGYEELFLQSNKKQWVPASETRKSDFCSRMAKAKIKKRHVCSHLNKLRETDESPVPLAEVYLRAARARRISVDELADAVRANVRSVFLAGIR